MTVVDPGTEVANHIAFIGIVALLVEFFESIVKKELRLFQRCVRSGFGPFQFLDGIIHLEKVFVHCLFECRQFHFLVAFKAKLFGNFGKNVA